MVLAYSDAYGTESNCSVLQKSPPCPLLCLLFPLLYLSAFVLPSSLHHFRWVLAFPVR